MEYFIKASVVFGIFYLCYKLFLQRETFFNANRWFLLSGLVMASLLPLIVIPIYVEFTPIAIPENLITHNQVDQDLTNSITFLQIISWIYLSGLVFFLGKLLVELSSLFTLIKKNKHKNETGFTFIETDNHVPPFSFFKWIVYNPNQFQDQELTHIINHEKVHAKQYHSIDVLLAQLCCTAFWFNPFCWLYKKELQQNLEFIADNKAQDISNCEKSYQNLLLKTSIPNHQSILTNNFYNSLTRLTVFGKRLFIGKPFGQVKKRIVMLHKSKSNKLQAWKFGIILPLLALFLMSFSTKKVYVNSVPENTINTFEKTNPLGVLANIEIVVITKDFTESDLENVKNQLLKEGLTIKFKGIKRNVSGEIMAIKIVVKSKESSANYNINGEKPISPIKISFDKEGNYIAIGNTSSSSHNKLTFISDDGTIHNLESEENVENVFVFSSDEHDIDENIKIEKNSNKIFVSKNGNIQTIKDGDKTIEIISISDNDNDEVVELNDDQHLGTKTVWVTKGQSDINWTSDTDSKNEKTYEVKIISSDGNTEDIHVTADNTNQKVKVIKIKEKDSVFTTLSEGTPLYILDGKEITKEEMEKVNPETIANINILKGEKAKEKYGEKAKEGVVEISTKK